MKDYLRALLPSAATTLSFLILPTVLTVYFIFTKYSDRFVADQNASYADIQSSWLGAFFLNQQWIEWFNRFMDFAFWGVIAVIVLMFIWAIQSSRTAIENHNIQQGFRNFHIDQTKWHSHFALVALLKVATILLAIYCVIALIGSAVPHLSLNISGAIYSLNSNSLLECAKTFIYIFALQYVFVTTIKFFNHLSAD